ncbi:hypothetical protein [Fibrobacter sp.]|uniref:hypothetical protein n=1 Tax=Fibrobacter sp. TaxID=35828 RepID=UPI00388F97E9
MNEANTLNDAERQPASTIDTDIVAVYADETEYHRFVNRRCAYTGLSNYPASFVIAPGGRCDLTQNDEKGLRKENPHNRSIWIRDPDPNANEGAFIPVIKGVKDKGGLLFEEIYKSELQCRAQRLHEAFIALGLKKWRIFVEETTSKSEQSSKSGKGSASVNLALVEASAEAGAAREKAEKFEQTLRQNFDLEYNESCGHTFDSAKVAKVEAEIKRLGLEKDLVVSSVLSARKRGHLVTKCNHDLDLRFSGELEKKFDLAFDLAARILFVSAKMKGEYHSFKKAVQIVQNSVKIHVED